MTCFYRWTEPAGRKDGDCSDGLDVPLSLPLLLPCIQRGLLAQLPLDIPVVREVAAMDRGKDKDKNRDKDKDRVTALCVSAQLKRGSAAGNEENLAAAGLGTSLSNSIILVC